MKSKLLFLLTFMFVMSLSLSSFAQIEEEGTPASFSYNLTQIEEINDFTPALDWEKIAEEDMMSFKDGTPMRAGFSVPVGIDINDGKGEWTQLPDGRMMWRIRLQSKNAKALGVVFDKFELPENSELYLYSADKNMVIGKFSSNNNNEYQVFSTQVIVGSDIIIEYIEEPITDKTINKLTKDNNLSLNTIDTENYQTTALLTINELIYMYVEAYDVFDDSKPQPGTSETCEVDINCSPVGDNWQNQKRGVAHIVFREGASWYLCSGTLVNNTLQNFTPYFLTADHCGGSASAADRLVWEFYFNFEVAGCDDNPSTAPTTDVITGCTLKARREYTTGGSDFQLLQFNSDVPLAYHPFYNGWDRSIIGATSGASIHHPAGDVKKISTYSTQLVISNGLTGTMPNSAWEVEWSSNANGWGVTEGGSSGSPIFNQNGLQVGTLSGGTSECANPTWTDVYGRFDIHWESNGVTSDMQLKPWLDPLGTNPQTMQGWDPTWTTDPPVANFVGTPTTISAGNSVTFTDMSTNGPTSWAWTFTGGFPASSTVRNPVVTYVTPGTYAVSLTATNAFGSDIETKNGYITVTDATTTITIGTGTTSGTYWPLGISTQGAAAYRYVRDASIYTAAEIGGGGIISNIEWRPGAAETDVRSAQIYLKHITATTFTAGTVASYLTGATLVYDGTFTPNVADWFSFALQTTFNYNGTDNLMVIVLVTTAVSPGNQPSNCYYTTVANAHQQWSGSAAPTGNGTVNGNRPNIRITKTYTPAPPVANFGTPPNLLFEDFEDGTLPTGWTNLDVDGDGNFWSFNNAGTLTTHSGTGAAYSASYLSAPLTPNNWLITPAVDLSNTTPNYNLEYWVMGQDPDWEEEHYGVYVSTTNTDPASFTLLAQETLPNGHTDYLQRTYSLNAYKGNSTVYIAFRHFNSTDWFYLNLDDVRIYSDGQPTSVTIYEGEYVNFTDLSTGAPIVWQWTVPGGTPNPSYDQNPTIQYNVAGTYDVTLLAANAGGSDTETKIDYVEVIGRAPIADFWFDANLQTTGFQPFIPTGGTVIYTDYSIQVPTAWDWTFEGGTPASSTDQNPVAVTYSTAGLYDVTLEATNAHGNDILTGTDLVAVEGTFNCWNFVPTDGLTYYTVGDGLLPGHCNDGAGGASLFTDYAELFTNAYEGEVTALELYVATETQGTGKNVVFKVWDGSSGTPGTVLGSKTLAITSFTVGDWNTVTFDAPIAVTGDFFVGYTITYDATHNYTTHQFCTALADRASGACTTYANYVAGGGWATLDTWFGGFPASLAVFPEFTYKSCIPTQPSTITGNATVCSGTSQTYSVTNVAGVTYTWNLPSGWTGTSTTNSITVTTSTTSGTITVTPSNGCGTGIARTLDVTVNPVLVPTISIAITAGANPMCAGSSVTFTATTTNGGTTPAYQWKVNGVNAGTNSPTFTTTTLTNGQVVTCVLTSNATCASPTTATSSGITMSVNPVVVPTISIAITTGANPTCAGSSVTFTATISNGGTTPTYQWKVDGVNAGTNSSTFTTTTLINNQIVTCMLTSNATCASPTSVTSTGITMTVNPVVTPSVAIAITSGANPSCAGSSVTFTATPTNGGTTPAYQWKVNGVNAGTNSPTFTTTTLTNGQIVTCVLTSNAACVSPTTATSTGITMTINPVVTPSVAIAITSGTNPTCAGSSVTFTATPTNGGTTPSYQWKVNGTNVGVNSPTFTTATLTNGQIVTCVMTSNATCASPTTATSTGITMTVNPVVTPSVTIAITSGSNPTCAGSNVTFTATPTNGGATPSYQWQVNGVNVGTNSTTYSTTTLVNTQVVTCILTSNATCASPTTATSAGITMTVNPVVTPSVTIALTSGTNPTCAGSSVTFTATPTNGGTTPSYQWKVNGVNAGSNSSTFTTTTLTNGQVVTCVLTSNAACASPTTATSTGITMTVNPVVVPSVSVAITSGANPTCAGSSVTFTATPTNGGTTPSYQWKVDGTNVGTNSPAFTSTTLTNGQVVTCVMTSNVTCATPTTATSTGITMTVNPVVTPSVSVAITSGANPTCAGSSVTFTATPTNGGATPSYQWKVNGANVGANSPTYTTAALTNGQIVTCVMTSNATCASPTTATSTGITMTVNLVVTPSVAIAITSGSNPSCAGSSVTFTATPTNGGTTPSYQWQINGVNAGTNSSTFTTTTLTNGQIVTCVMTSNATCASPTSATSTGITMTVNPVVIPNVSIAITSGTNPTCAGSSVTFTATPTNGGTTPSYQWKVNGVNAGTNSSTFTTTTLTNGQIVTCVMTSNAACASPSTATSTGITITVNPVVVPSVSIAITSGTNPTCAGSSVTFTATPSNGGITPSYQWKVDGTNVGSNSSTFTTTTLTNGQVVTCILTSNATCATPATATSTGITMSINPVVVPTVSIAITSGTNPTCASSSVTFTATPVNGGTTPSYQWQINGVNAGTNSSTFTTTTLTNGQIVTCIMTSNATCASPASATSAGITMTVNPAAVPSVSIAITSGTNPMCAGSSATFTATPTNGGTTPSYQWKVDGINAGTNSSTFTTSTLTNSQVVTCVLTSNATCASPATATSNSITMTVNSILIPSVSIAITAGSNPTCSGAEVTFTATPVNGGTTPSYQWKVNGINVGSNSNIYSSSTFTDGDIVTCIMTSNSPCASPTTATSSGITININATIVPSVNIAITSGTNPTCAGSSVTFTATPVNGGTTPSYQWQVNGVNAGSNSPTFTTTSLTSGQVVTCILTSNSPCASPTTATSSGITMTVNPVVTPSVTIALTSGTNPTCAGSSVTFTATPVNGGTTPSYQWQVNGVNAGTNSSTFTSTTLTSGQVVTCILTSNATCASPTTATSTGITMTVNPVVIPSVAIAITSGTNPTCAGSSVTFTATPTNGGATPSYQWKVDGTNAGINSATFTTTTLTNGQIVTCVMTSNATCASPVTATSSGITMSINPIVVPAVSIAITSGSNPTCAGSSVTFTATPVNGGITPSYQWQVNGVNAGTNLSTFTSTTLTTGQIVTCIMTSNATCASPVTATSSGITMSINPIVVPAVSIAITSGSNPTCSGSSVTFTATPVNGGTTPSYQWKVNGVNAGTNLSTFTTTTLTNGQIVTCEMISNATCASPSNATSTGITMNVNPIVVPSVSIAITSGSNPTCSESSVTFTATPTNGGSTPSYQWKVDGVNAGINSSTFTSTTLTNGQIVTCVMTSNATCASPVTATSSGITMSVNPVVAPSVTIAITSGSNPTCEGSSVTFTATPTNGGTTPSYQWKVNGVNVGTNLSTYTTTALTNGQIVTCTLTSNAACATPTTATSTGISMIVNSTLVPSVSIAITSGSNPTCEGSSVTFTATPVNGGTTPAYQWKVNGVNTGTNSPIFASNTLTNGQIVTCELTSSSPCASPTFATSTGITMTINPVVVPSVSIAITSGSNPSCDGSLVTFTATPINGGTTPSYQWKVDGVGVGSNSPSFTSLTLTDGQIVTCTMTSNATCVNPVSVTSTGITMTINPVVVPSVSIAITSGSNPTCAGTSVIFTATPTNGGTTPSYQWKVDGINAGSNSPTYTSTSLTDGQVVTCVLTSNATCASSTTATSTGITMIVNPIVTPTVSIAITGGSNPTCEGSLVAFTATPVNGGLTPDYQWQVNGVNVGSNSNEFTTSTLNDGETVSCLMTSSEACVTSSTAVSSGITVTVNTLVVPTISIAITVGSNPTCFGSAITFTATGTNEGSSPVYQWLVDGVAAGTNSAEFTTSVLTNGQTVACQLTSDASCASPVVVTSEPITMTINTLLDVDVSVTVDNNPTCLGSTMIFTATPVNGGTTPVYQWMVNGVNDGVNSEIYVNNSLQNGDIVTCQLTSSETCVSNSQAVSNPVTVQIIDAVTADVTIDADFTSICEGGTVSFTATPVNGGSTPGYQWLLNGTNVGSDLNTYTGNTFTDGDLVSCLMTSSEACAINNPATSNVVTLTVNPLLTVGNSIAADQNPICEGTEVNITATPTNGGTVPSYQWVLNGVNVGSDSYIYSDNTLAEGDEIYCILTSSESCVVENTANSNTVIMSVLPTPIAGYTYVANNLEITFTNISQNASEYFWEFGDSGTSIEVNPIYTYAIAGTYDVILTASNSVCEDVYTSTINVTNVSIYDLTDNTKLFVYPNPNDGLFNIKFETDKNFDADIEIYTIDGKLIYQNGVKNVSNGVSEQIDIRGYAVGVYQLNIYINNEVIKQNIIIK